MNANEFKKIPQEKFAFVQANERIHDKKFETKPIGYFKDAWIRFKRNKASVTAALIILCIMLFAFITPLFSNYKISDADGVYAKMRPKVEFMEGTGFWDGGYSKKLNDRYYMYMVGIGMGAEDPDGLGNVTWDEAYASEWNPILSAGEAYKAQGRDYRDCRIESYNEVGFKYLNVTMAEYEKIAAWQEETGRTVLYPMIDLNKAKIDDDANYWYLCEDNGAPVDTQGEPLKLSDVQKNGLVDNYMRDAEGNIQYFLQRDKSMVQIRVLYYNYFQYKNGYEPIHAMGTDAQGYDIMIRLAHGVQLSLLLAVCISLINLTIGTIYGAIEGYYGGWIDMLGERISDILNGVPFVVVATLFQLHLVNTGKVSTVVGLLLAFVLTGWIGTAYRVRTQFYRFKHQEYVLAARTLGARDARLMFKHIFPNALGTIITSSILVIPSTIFTESTLSYLGIVNFNGQNITSLGTMLSNGQGYLATDPHIILFPAVVISLLMISFNLFGNGLRDAFNPSLRGAEE